MRSALFPPSFLKKLVYPAILLVLGVGSNSWILGGQLDGMEKRTDEKFKSMGEKFKSMGEKFKSMGERFKVEDGVATVERNVKNLTKRQTDMENHDMKAVQKLLLDCRQKR